MFSGPKPEPGGENTKKKTPDMAKKPAPEEEPRSQARRKPWDIPDPSAPPTPEDK